MATAEEQIIEHFNPVDKENLVKNKKYIIVHGDKRIIANFEKHIDIQPPSKYHNTAVFSPVVPNPRLEDYGAFYDSKDPWYWRWPEGWRTGHGNPQPHLLQVNLETTKIFNYDEISQNTELQRLLHIGLPQELIDKIKSNAKGGKSRKRRSRKRRTQKKKTRRKHKKRRGKTQRKVRKGK